MKRKSILNRSVQGVDGPGLGRPLVAEIKLVKIKVKVEVKIGGKLEQSVDAPGLGRPLVAGFVHRQPPPASTSRPRCCSEHPQYKKQPEHTGCPTHFQNCHRLAAAGQYLAW